MNRRQEKTLEVFQMTSEEVDNIATAVLKNKVKENIEKIKEFWLKLKEKGQINRELGNIEKGLGYEYSLETIRDFCTIILEPFVPEIFGRPKKQMTDKEIGAISYDILLLFVRRNGLRIFPENQERRRLGNVAAATGIELERLKIFANDFLHIVADTVYPVYYPEPKGQTMEQLFDLH